MPGMTDSVFDAKIGGASAGTTAGRYAAALNDVQLIAACVAFAAAGLAFTLIRGKDFHTATAPTASAVDTPAPAR